MIGEIISKDVTDYSFVHCFVRSFITSSQNGRGNALCSGGRGGTESLWTQQAQANGEERLGLNNTSVFLTTAFTGIEYPATEYLFHKWTNAWVTAKINWLDKRSADCGQWATVCLILYSPRTKNSFFYF